MSMTHERAMELQHALIDKALDIVEAKRHDYSGDSDPFANLRMSQFVGVESWRGVVVRLMDKLSRIRNIMEHSGDARVQDETIEDTLADVINYTCILYGLIVEELETE